MFEFDADRGFTSQPSVSIVAPRDAHQSVEARQRDIYESHRHRAFSLAYYMTGNEVEAENILISTFVRVYRAAQEPTGDDVDLALLQELRERLILDATLVPPSSLSATDSADSPAKLGDRNVKRTDLEEAVQGLPPEERLLFLLRDVEGYTPSAIAQLLQMPEPQVQRGIFSARLRLRQILAGDRSAKSRAA